MRVRFWLIVSICFNLFLAGFLFVAKEQLKEPVIPETPGIGNVIERTNVIIRRENFTWDQIQSTNYPTLIKNLRAIGCPEQTIRDIVTTDINRYYERRRLTEVVYPNYQWWKSVPDPALAQAAEEKLRNLEAERRDLLTSLLGPGWEVETKEAIAARGGITLTGPILGDLSAQAKKAILDIIAPAQLKIEAYEEQQRLQGAPADPVQMVRLREEPLIQLAAVTTPDVYEEFVLRYSPAAQQLREMTRTMELSPDVFKQLFSALNGIIGQPVYYYAGTDQDTIKQQQALGTQADAVIKATLGADVYANFQLSQDATYRSAQALVQQLNLPATDLMPIYQINRATQTEMDRIRNDSNLSNDEKVEALAQTQVEAQQSLQQLLGADAFQRWLQAQGQSQTNQP
jgi:hypothetical protein